jgi:aminodeoxyfutalosine deaminase
VTAAPGSPVPGGAESSTEQADLRAGDDAGRAVLPADAGRASLPADNARAAEHAGCAALAPDSPVPGGAESSAEQADLRAGDDAGRASLPADAARAAEHAGRAALPYPKIELHVHLEGAVSPAALASIARRNAGPAAAEALQEALAVRVYADFAGFIAAWVATSRLLQRERDFREVVLDYAAAAAAQGVVYLEAAFSPAEPVRRGASWEEVFEGYCSGAEEALTAHGVEVRLTPEITRNFPPESGEEVAHWAGRYRDRGVVGLGLGGDEAAFPPELFARAFALGREAGLRAAPHAGETAGPASVRAALNVLHAERLRHGVRAAEDPGLLAELAARRVVCDVTPTSNLRLGVVPAAGVHPLPHLLAAGVPCSIGTDDPALFGVDLTHDCALAVALGHAPQAMFVQALAGAFCDEPLKARLRALGEAFDWPSVPPAAAVLRPETA